MNISQHLGFLHRLRSELSQVVLRDLYVTCIHPVIENASVVWSGLSKTDASRLERLNRRATRQISHTSCKDDVPHELLLARAGIQLITRRRLQQALFTHRFAHQLLLLHSIGGACSLAAGYFITAPLPAAKGQMSLSP